MELSGTFTERRIHPRAPLRLPARIRWPSPLGLRVEMTKTVDVSRDKVLVRRNEPSELFARVWIVFAFVRGAGVSVQPETPGRIIRVVPLPKGKVKVMDQLSQPVGDHCVAVEWLEQVAGLVPS